MWRSSDGALSDSRARFFHIYVWGLRVFERVEFGWSTIFSYNLCSAVLSGEDVVDSESTIVFIAMIAGGEGITEIKGRS